MRKIIYVLSGQKYFYIQLDITNSCNLNCTHRYHSHHLNDGAISYDEWLDILVQCQTLVSKLYLSPYFIFCGGEPFISKNLLLLIQKIRHLWPYSPIDILTNGTIYPPKLLQRLSHFDVQLQVSLDGSNAPSHDIKRGRHSFEKTLEGIKQFRDYGLPVHLLSILSFQSLFQIENFFSLAKNLEVKSMNFTRFIPEGQGKTLNSQKIDRELTPLELKGALQDIIFYSKQYNVKTNTNQPLFCLIDENIGHHGLWGFNSIIIDYLGNLKMSSRASAQLGNIKKKSLDHLYFTHPELEKIRSGLIEVCGTCSFYQRCGGDRNVSYAHTGSFLKKDPGCWIN